MNVFAQRVSNLRLQRVVGLFIYRLLIVLYGGFIVCSYDNFIASYYYALLIPIYVFLLKVINKQGAYFEFILDNCIIFSVLYGKTPLDVVCYTYVLFPIINCFVYVEKQLRYGLLISISFLLLVALDEGLVLFHIVVLLFVWLAGVNTWYTTQLNVFLANVTAHIDNYYTDNDGTRRPHEIYNSIIEEINTYLEEKHLIDIYSYILKEDNTLWLVNSSTFMWERTLLLNPIILDTLRKKQYAFDKKSRSKYYMVNQKGVCYVYMCIVSPRYSEVSIREEYAINYVLQLTFGKVSTMLATEYRISETRRKAFEETKGHIEYVTRALKVMHFIRNKLSPIRTVITFFNEYDRMERSVREKMENRIKQEVNQANKDLIDIVQTANYLLDKQNNPYDGFDVENRSIKVLFVILSEIVEYHLNGTVVVSKEITNNELRRDVRISMTQLKILFSDIVSNIDRYKESDYKIEMGLIEDKIFISFMNDFDPKKESICRDLVRDINNKENEGIIIRKSHGIYNIKSSSSLMGIEIKADIETINNKKMFNLTTYFNLYESNKDSGN